MPRYPEWNITTADKRKRLAVDFVRDHPHIVAFWFQRRVELFKKHVLFLKYKIINYQDQFKWQARRSTYSYSLYYYADTLNADVKLASNNLTFTIA